MAIVKEGLFICLYGPPKAGKTVAACAAASSGIVAALPGALLPTSSHLGFSFGDREKRVHNVHDSVSVVKQFAGKVPTILVDDLTLQVENYRRELEKKNTTFGELWRMVCGSLLELRDVSRHATVQGTTVIVTAHEGAPRKSGDKPIKGGPKLPGQLQEDFAGMVDILARAVYDESASPWRYVMRTGPQGDYSTGDRISVFPDPGPLNLAEGLREGGYNVPRPAGLEWMEPAVEAVASFILKNGMESWRDSIKKCLTNPKMTAGRDPKHLRWLGQDALHRAVIRHHRADTLGWLSDSNEITL